MLRAVVFTFIVAVAGVVPPVNVSVPGLTVQVAAAGAPVQASVTVPAKPCVPGVTVSMLVPESPAGKVSVPGFALIV
jgi:hypothetical protein